MTMGFRATLAGLLAIMVLVGGAQASPRRPFTVADSIGLTWVAHDYGAPDAERILLSPDGRRFALTTRRGDLTTGRNDYALKVWDASVLRRWFDGPAGAPPPPADVLTRLSTDNSWPAANAIDAVEWTLDGQALTFVGRGEDRRDALYRARLGVGTARRLFEPPAGVRNIVSYDLSPDGSSAIFAAYVVADWGDRQESGYVVDPWDGGAGATAAARPEDGPYDLVYFVADLASGAVSRLDITASGWAKRAYFSPSGRWAVVSVNVTPPAAWLKYPTVAQIAGSAVTERDLRRAFRGFPLTRYLLVDVKAGRARPLLDAPALVLGQTGQGALSAPVWSVDERSVVVGPTYLPGDAAPSRQVIAEIALASGDASVVAEIPQWESYGMTLPYGVTLEALGAGRIGLGFATAGRPVVDRAYRKVGGRWRSTSLQSRAGRAAAPSVTLRLREGLNQPPVLVVEDSATGRSRILEDLNPQLADIELGRAEDFRWKDRQGGEHLGVLVFPPAWERGKRYPLVIQAGGRLRDEFLVDGAGGATGGYAARALAGRGMIVLQMPFDYVRGAAPVTRETWAAASEAGRFVSVLEGAIDALDRGGLADRTRVGLTGFSRNGMLVEYALTFGARPIAAADIADSTAATPAAYALSAPMMREWEQDWYMGAPFWGEGKALWYERSPAFNLERIRTPIRIESYGRGVTPRAETYAILRRMGRPAEMLRIPFAGHLLTSPRSRWTSQEGLVDWFDFWLNGREEPDPRKQEQYLRWRALREEWRDR